MGEMTDDDLLDWMHEELQEAASRLGAWREAAHDSYAFYANDQWSDEDRMALEEQGRAATVFNRASRTISAVSGQEIQNRQEVRYYPREIGDAGVSEMMTNAARWVRDRALAEDEESEAFVDLLICGVGALNYAIDADGSEPNIAIERIDPLSLLWDYTARKKNLRDAKWIAKIRLMEEGEILDAWPDADLGRARGGTKYLDYPGGLRSVVPPRYDANRAVEPSPDADGHEVVEFSYWDHESYYQVIGEQGQLIEFSPAKWKTVANHIKSSGMRWAKRRRKAYHTVYMVGRELLERGKSVSQFGLPIRCMTGLRDRNSNSWFGLMEVMKDPQRLANKLLSQFLHVVNTNAKGGLLAEADAFEDVRKAEDDWARSDSIVWMRPGGLNKIREKSFGQIPVGVERLLGHAIDAITEVSGVNAELMGAVVRNQPGVLEESRKRAGITMVAAYFDSMRLYHKDAGNILMDMIRSYISDGRLIRFLGREGEKYVPLMRDSLTVEYDIVVDEAPASTSVKDRAFGALMQIIPLALQAGIPVPPDVIDYTPIPASLIAEWRKLMAPKEPDSGQEEQRELLKAAQIAEIEERRSRARLNLASAAEKSESVRLEAEVRRAKMIELGYSAEMERQRIAEEHMANMELEKLRHANQTEAAILGAKLSTDQSMAVGGADPVAMSQLLEQANRILHAIEHGVPTSAMQDEAASKIMSGLDNLTRLLRAPKERRLHRDKSGRATHAVEIIIEPTGTIN